MSEKNDDTNENTYLLIFFITTMRPSAYHSSGTAILHYFCSQLLFLNRIDEYGHRKEKSFKLF